MAVSNSTVYTEKWNPFFCAEDLVLDLFQKITLMSHEQSGDKIKITLESWAGILYLWDIKRTPTHILVTWSPLLGSLSESHTLYVYIYEKSKIENNSKYMKELLGLALSGGLEKKSV